MPDGEPIADPLADAMREEKARAVCARLQSIVGTDGRVSDSLLLFTAGALRNLGVEEWLAVEMLGEALPESLSPRVERIAAIAFGMSGLSDAPAHGLDWLLQLILARFHAGLLVGLSGAGKSMLLATLAVAAASGGAFFGRYFIASVGVLILSGEAADEVPPRLRALANDLGLKPDALPAVCAPCHDSRDIQLHVEAAVMRLRREFGCGLGLLLLDNLRTIYRPPDEEDQAFAEATMRGLREIAETHGACVVLAHHTGKRDNAPRGAQAWIDTSNFVLQIDALQDRKTGFFRKRRLRLTKTRHGPPLDLGAFRIENGPAGAVLRFGEEPRPAEDPFEPEGRRRSPVKTRRGRHAGSPDERLLAALGSAREAGEAVEIEGRSYASIDTAARHSNAGRPEPSRWRNLTRSVLAAAARAGVRRVDHGGVIYLEIPGGP